MMTTTYLTVTTRISDQKISDSAPKIACSLTSPKAEQRLPGRVERRGADVAEHDAERRQRQAAGARAGLGRSAMRDGIRHRSRIPAGEAPLPASRQARARLNAARTGSQAIAIAGRLTATRCSIGSCRERLRHIEQTNRRQGRSIGRSGRDDVLSPPATADCLDRLPEATTSRLTVCSSCCSGRRQGFAANVWTSDNPAATPGNRSPGNRSIAPRSGHAARWFAPSEVSMPQCRRRAGLICSAALRGLRKSGNVFGDIHGDRTTMALARQRGRRARGGAVVCGLFLRPGEGAERRADHDRVFDGADRLARGQRQERPAGDANLGRGRQRQGRAARPAGQARSITTTRPTRRWCPASTQSCSMSTRSISSSRATAPISPRRRCRS